jgi:hypothetical protein
MTTSTGPKAPKFKRDVTFCGADVDGMTCHRLPAHHGDHRSFVTGNGVKAPRAARPKSVRGSGDRVVARRGQRYTQVTRKDGSIVLAPVAPAEAEPGKTAPVIAPKPAGRKSAAKPPKVAAR